MNVISDPVFISFLVFILASVLVFIFTITRIKDAYQYSFCRDVLVEAHGMLFDILIIGTFIFAIQRMLENRREKKARIQRWKEEIEDYLGWQEKEAAVRIAGNIRRLNREGIEDEFNLPFAYLKGAKLRRAKMKNSNLAGINLSSALLEGADFSDSDFWDPMGIPRLDHANLYDAIFKNSNLEYASFKNAMLHNTNFDNAILIEADLSTIRAEFARNFLNAKSLYKAKLNSEFEKIIKEKCPHLLEKPED